MDHGAEYYRRFLGGDKEALTAIIREYKDGLTFFLCGFTGDLTAAEELTQETFVRLYVKKPRFSGRSQFKTWLYGIGRNTAREYCRRSKQTEPLPEGWDAPDETADPALAYFREEKNRAVHRVMRRLKPEYRQILWLSYFEALDRTEIAAILKKSVNSVDVLLHRARKALRTEWEKEGYSE
ncbi:MAG: RNA polymerase sigma factor [Clostridia bacterium]|nr:RNA polymerase sigma factor [Clostridia bacterium]